MAIKLKRGGTGGCSNVRSQVIRLLSETFFLLMTLLVEIIDLLNGVPSNLHD
jgi:hypothetical protein